MTSRLILGTRGSPLALAQSRGVAAGVRAATDLAVELEVIRTRGDELLKPPLPEIGGKGLFTEALDAALLEGRIDLAVHSLKDLPVAPVDGLDIACVPAREDPRDVAVFGSGADALADLAEGAVVGTSSPRRAALLAAFFPGLATLSIRGNLDTRLGKLDRGEGYDALVLAAAGLSRLGLSARIGEWLERTAWLPAPGQGALAVVTRAGDTRVRAALAPLDHPESGVAVRAERAFLSRLEGGCSVPVGALGLPFRGGLRLRGLVVSPDGRRLVRADLTGRREDASDLGARLADLLIERGAGHLLDAGTASAAP